MDDALALVMLGRSRAVVDRFTVRSVPIHLPWILPQPPQDPKSTTLIMWVSKKCLMLKNIYLMHKKVENRIPYHSQNLNMKPERPL